MALPATAVLECRTTGSDTQCAGGFNSARGGTDYSQRDTAIATGTVTSSTTTVTATTGIFTSDMVGNYITDGTTVKEITAYTSSTVVTVDSAPSWTAATVYVGGAVASPGKAAGVVVAGNDVWIKTGTYTISSTTSNIAGGRVSISTGGVVPNNAMIWRGYGTTRGDTGTALLQVASSGVTSISVIDITAGQIITLANINVDGQNKTAIRAIAVAGNYHRVWNCKVSNATNGGIVVTAAFTEVLSCEMTGCSGNNPLNIAVSSSRASRCWVHDNTITGGTGADAAQFDTCIFANNTGATSDGLGNASSAFIVRRCIFYNSGRHGINLQGNAVRATTITDSIFYGNGGYGISTNGVSDALLVLSCAGGNNTSGNYDSSQIPTASLSGFQAIAANPFDTAAIAAATDIASAFAAFRPNSTASGGALLRGAGLIPYGDIGASQHQDSGGFAPFGGGLIGVA